MTSPQAPRGILVSSEKCPCFLEVSNSLGLFCAWDQGVHQRMQALDEPRLSHRTSPQQPEARGQQVPQARPLWPRTAWDAAALSLQGPQDRTEAERDGVTEASAARCTPDTVRAGVPRGSGSGEA